ncbi:MAG: hypothetical protein H6673_04010 [Anaerolineales bacterium]|nr:hypothetical protein [Anaerolineales bacterium]
MPNDDKAQVERYRQLVLEYERLDEDIDALLMAHNGGTEDMSPDDYHHYRELAQRRDELYNQIRELESVLFDD